MPHLSSLYEYDTSVTNKRRRRRGIPNIAVYACMAHYSKAFIKSSSCHRWPYTGGKLKMGMTR